MSKLCPECKVELVPEYQEVDIEVGVQSAMVGAVCPNCGCGFATCSSCGAFDFEKHETWCLDKFAEDE